MQEDIIICVIYTYLYPSREFSQVSETDVGFSPSPKISFWYKFICIFCSYEPNVNKFGSYRPSLEKIIYFWKHGLLVSSQFFHQDFFITLIYTFLLNADYIIPACYFVWVAGSPSVIFPAKNKSCSSTSLIYFITTFYKQKLGIAQQLYTFQRKRWKLQDAVKLLPYQFLCHAF